MNILYFVLFTTLSALGITIFTYAMMGYWRDFLKPYIDSKKTLIQIIVMLAMLLSILLMIALMNFGISRGLYWAEYYLNNWYSVGYIFTWATFAGFVFYIEKQIQTVKLLQQESSKPISITQVMYGQMEWAKDLISRNQKNLNLIALVYVAALSILALLLMFFPILRILIGV
jgi:hypothetical protein